MRESSFEGLYARYAVDDDPNDREFAMHVHESCEIFYFVSGNAEYLVEGARYPLESGSILIMRPSESHRAKILGSEKYERYAVNFSVSVIDNIDPERRILKAFFDRPLGRGNLFLPTEFGGEDLRKIFEEMCRKSNSYETQLNIKTHIFWLLDRINRAWLKRGTEDYAPANNISERIVLYINYHLFEELSVPMLAKHFFLSSSQFSRIFKQATGAAPWEYITIKRLTAARKKIRGGETVQYAAESCGFSDYSTFYRAYVKYFGRSPKYDNM
ncbi:MAG: AraC family transcriptional regulator [Oscillospiraceae bacterium]|nr:AraC family transcriptional regulator [Oscillospiraceae bacterium]